MLAVIALEAQEETILMVSEEQAGFDETIVDRGMGWLRSMARTAALGLHVPA